MLASHLVAANTALRFGEEVNAKVEAERISGPSADWMWLLASAVAAAGTGTAAVTVATATRIARRIAVQVRRVVASLTNRNIYKCIICNQ
jgi:hypothetical protein